jgi:hypothetical protein
MFIAMHMLLNGKLFIFRRLRVCLAPDSSSLAGRGALLFFMPQLTSQRQSSEDGWVKASDEYNNHVDNTVFLVASPPDLLFSVLSLGSKLFTPFERRGARGPVGLGPRR